MGKCPARAPLFKKKYLFISILLLFLAVAFLAFLNRPQDMAEPGTIRIMHGGELIKSFTLEELQALPRVEMEKTILSSNKPQETGVFTGTDLQEVLQAADPSLPGKCRRLVARASDGFAASYDKAELLQPENILVVYAKDGLPLENAAAGGAGPLRIVVVDDPFGNRCIKHLCELEIEQ